MTETTFDATASIEKTLKQYGVPGMRWGKRKAQQTLGSIGSDEPTPVVIRSRPGKIETSGGKNHPPSDDAKIAAGHKQLARASSIHALSNKEIQALVTRMNLEAQYAKAIAENRKPKSKFHQAIEKFMQQELNTALQGKTPKSLKLVDAIRNPTGYEARHVVKKKKN